MALKPRQYSEYYFLEVDQFLYPNVKSSGTLVAIHLACKCERSITTPHCQHFLWLVLNVELIHDNCCFSPQCSSPKCEIMLKRSPYLCQSSCVPQSYKRLCCPAIFIYPAPGKDDPLLTLMFWAIYLVVIWESACTAVLWAAWMHVSSLCSVIHTAPPGAHLWQHQFHLSSLLCLLCFLHLT